MKPCSYLDNGSASAVPSGGTHLHILIYGLAGGQTTASIHRAVSRETYTVTVTDSKGCSVTVFCCDNSPPPVLAVWTPIIQPLIVLALASGMLFANPSRRTSGYTYSWSPGGSTSAMVSGVIAGTYTVTVNRCQQLPGDRDNHGNAACRQHFFNSSVITNVSCAGGSNGSVAVTTSGGTPAYSYLWLPGGQTAAGISGSPAGTYTVTVTDSNGCLLNLKLYYHTTFAISDQFQQTNVSCAGGSTVLQQEV